MSDAPTPPSPPQPPVMWDAVAPTYSEDADQWVGFLEEALRILPVGASDRVLDLATGPGTLAILAAPRALRIDAVDFSPGMIEQVGARAQRAGVENVHGAVMDAAALDFADASFDAAFCIAGFFLFADRAAAFREVRRVLRPGGRLLITTWAPIERRPLMKLAFDAMATAFPHLPRPGKGDLQSPEECIREMSDAGFRDVAVTTFTGGSHLPSAEAYVELVARSAAPLAMARKKLGEAGFAAMKAQLANVLRDQFPERGRELTADALYTIGTR